jgi:hypothetical protein
MQCRAKNSTPPGISRTAVVYVTSARFQAWEEGNCRGLVDCRMALSCLAGASEAYLQRSLYVRSDPATLDWKLAWIYTERESPNAESAKGFIGLNNLTRTVIQNGALIALITGVSLSVSPDHLFI